MTATFLPEWNLVAWCVAIVSIVAAAEALRRAFRWFRTAAKNAISAAVDLSETAHLVRFHLGPNGTTPPLHKRVSDIAAIEKVHHRQNADRLDEMNARLPPAP